MKHYFPHGTWAEEVLLSFVLNPPTTFVAKNDRNDFNREITLFFRRFTTSGTHSRNCVGLSDLRRLAIAVRGVGPDPLGQFARRSY